MAAAGDTSCSRPSGRPASTLYPLPQLAVWVRGNPTRERFYAVEALVDTGAQVNIVDEDFARKIGTTKWENAVHAIRGVGAAMRTSFEARLEVLWNNGTIYVGDFVAIPRPPRKVILGAPFLHAVRALICYRRWILETRHGVSPFSRQATPTPSTVALALPLTACTGNVRAPLEDITTEGSWKKSSPMKAIEYPSQAHVSLPSAVPPPPPPAHQATETLQELKMPKLTPEERTKVQELLRLYSDLWLGERRGLLRFVTHRIEVSTNQPIRTPARRFTAEERRVMQQELEKMLKAGVVRPSQSPHVQEVVMVLKKTGDWRFCIDFRPVNRVTIRDAHPLPRITDLLRRIGSSSYFVALDLRSGYWQIRMEEESIPYTAFRCNGGLYEFLVMPFGLTNAPATFQRAMEVLFSPLREGGVLVYLDDILVHSPTFEGAYTLLAQVLGILRAAGLTANLGKCVFFEPELLYLGHIISGGIRRPNLKKIAALDRITDPCTVTEVRSVLGLLNYYHPYIPDFASTATPVYNLLRGLPKGASKKNSQLKVRWSKECAQAVKTLTDRLRQSVLQLPDEWGATSELLVETDASDLGTGAVLSLRTEDGTWKPIEFFSHRFTAAEQKWHTQEREAFAIILALENWSDYLRGRKVRVLTDHASLQWMMEAKKGRVARWALRLAEYDIEILHRRGTEMVHVDSLSRMALPDEGLADRMIFDSCFAATWNHHLEPKDAVIAAVTAKKRGRSRTRADSASPLPSPEVVDLTSDLDLPEPHCGHAGNTLEADHLDPRLEGSFQELIEDVVRQENGPDEYGFRARTALPSCLAEVGSTPTVRSRFNTLFRKYDDGRTELPTLDDISACQKEWEHVPAAVGYYLSEDGDVHYRGALWVPPPLRVAVMRAFHHQYRWTHTGLKACKKALKGVLNWAYLHADLARYINSCWLCQATRQGRENWQGTTGLAPMDAVLSRVHVDVWTCHWNGEQTKVLTMLDANTRWVEAEILEDESSINLWDAFHHAWVSRFGCPQRVITDNFAGFVGGAFAKNLAAFGVLHSHSTPHHPQGNSPVEVFHKRLRVGLTQVRLQHEDSTVRKALDWVLYAYRSTPLQEIGDSPAFLLHGVDPCCPPYAPLTSARSRAGYIGGKECLAYLSEHRFRLALAAHQQARRRQEALQEKRIPMHFAVNEIVLLPPPLGGLFNADNTTFGEKLSSRFGGIYRVVKTYGNDQKAWVRHMLTGKFYRVTTSQVRKLELPLDREQQELWPTVRKRAKTSR